MTTTAWRNVRQATWRSKRSLLQPWRAGREWLLWLDCGHVEYRLMRYSVPAESVDALTLEQALPAPKRVRCAQCQEATQ